MSKFHTATTDDSFSGRSFPGSTAARVGACALILIAALLTASCGLIDGNNPPQTLSLSGNLPAGVANQSYSAVLTVGGGNAPYQFVVKSGNLPPGMTLNPATGSVAGTPTAAGSYAFQVGVS